MEVQGIRMAGMVHKWLAVAVFSAGRHVPELLVFRTRVVGRTSYAWPVTRHSLGAPPLMDVDTNSTEVHSE